MKLIGLLVFVTGIGVAAEHAAQSAKVSSPPPPPKQTNKKATPHPQVRQNVKTAPAYSIQDLQQMRPADRSRILQTLPKDHRVQVEAKLKQYDALPAAEKARLNQQYALFRNLPPQEQESIRKAFLQYQTSAPARQELMRSEIKKLNQLPAAEREKALQSRDFKQTFSEDEQTTVRQLLEAPEE